MPYAHRFVFPAKHDIFCVHAVTGEVTIGMSLSDIPEFATRHVGFIERDTLFIHHLCVLLYHPRLTSNKQS